MPRPIFSNLLAALSAGAMLPALAGCGFGGGDVRKKLEARTAEAAVTIVRTDTVRMYDEDLPREQQQLRHAVKWQFEAGGKSYVDSIPMTLYFPDKQYKVCYEPQDPTNSSILEVEFECGKWQSAF